MTRPTYDLPSNLPATPSPTQGEKPAEARAAEYLSRLNAVRARGSVMTDQISPLLDEAASVIRDMLTSPQEGATAVGADDVREFLEAMRGVTPADITQAGINMAVEFIEALQGQVERLSANVADQVRRKRDGRAILIARAEAAESSLRTLGDRHAATERDACMWAERYSALQSAHEEQHQRRLAQEEKIDTLGDALERAREALGRIAGKNNLDGGPDDEVQSAACNALYECELIAREALEATPSSPSDKGADE